MNAKIRLAVFERASRRCEACGRFITFETGRLDHFFGRAKAVESVATCWALCRWCDAEKTENKPSGIFWFRLFRDHCRKHRYQPEFERAQLRIAVLKQKGLGA